MTFTDNQMRKLRAPIRPQVVKQRDVEGKVLHYLEGWHVVSEANRIFGFDAWDRETVYSQCVWQKQAGVGYAAAYLTRVRITVRAGERTIQREGLGSGEATALTPGQAHERASKAAETDATKRALSTFGNSFGLSLYRDKAEAPQAKRARAGQGKKSSPIPDLDQDCDEGGVGEATAELSLGQSMVKTTLPVWVPGPSQLEDADPGLNREEASATRGMDRVRERIEKSALPLSEPKRLRSREHLRFVASQPCLACGRSPSQAHHLRFTQPRAMGRKVSDEFTVPLCAIHHHELHMRGNERAWWEERQIDPLPVADELWAASREDSPWPAAEPRLLPPVEGATPEPPHGRDRDQVDP